MPLGGRFSRWGPGGEDAVDVGGVGGEVVGCGLEIGAEVGVRSLGGALAREVVKVGRGVLSGGQRVDGGDDVVRERDDLRGDRLVALGDDLLGAVGELRGRGGEVGDCGSGFIQSVREVGGAGIELGGGVGKSAMTS